MIIKTQAEIHGNTFDLVYKDVDSFDALPQKYVRQSYGVCFCDDKLVIGHNKKGHWSLIGGTVEEGEHYDGALIREVKEESNMQVLEYWPIGYQVSYIPNKDPNYQLRYFCKVKPYGPFEGDPDDSVDGIKLIDPARYKDYFDWGSISDRLIERALELKASL